MYSSGDCFVALPPNCPDKTVIFGRNAEDEAALDVAQEVFFYDESEAGAEKSDGGAEPECGSDGGRIILQKPRPGVWGGDCGANEHNVCIGLTWTADEAENGSGNLCATDIVRYALAAADTAEKAVEQIGGLVEAHGADNAKFNCVVCDPAEAWAVSCGGKLWAARRFTEGFHRFPSNGLAVNVSIDKSSAELGDALKTLGLWNGEGDLDFAACFEAAADTSVAWSGTEPAGDGSYTLTSMFNTLRSASKADASRSAAVSVLSAVGISCHWFTATPNASESVFKPFVFAPNPKISPLTKVPADSTLTLLHKLHAQRKPVAVEDLKALEAACVEEVDKYLADHPAADEELDELMKDCVEAEVKFYR